MSMTDAHEQDLNLLIYNGTAIDGVAENDTTTPLTQFYLSLHTADPGDAANQTTSEVAYTGYARVPVARSPAGLTVTGDSVSPTADMDFPEAEGGTETATHFGLGTDAAGTGKLMRYGPLTPNISISTGVTPRVKNTSVLMID